MGAAGERDTGKVLQMVVLFADPFGTRWNLLPRRGWERARDVSKCPLCFSFPGPHHLGPRYLLQGPLAHTSVHPIDWDSDEGDMGCGHPGPPQVTICNLKTVPTKAQGPSRSPQVIVHAAHG